MSLGSRRLHSGPVGLIGKMGQESAQKLPESQLAGHTSLR